MRSKCLRPPRHDLGEHDAGGFNPCGAAGRDHRRVFRWRGRLRRWLTCWCGGWRGNGPRGLYGCGWLRCGLLRRDWISRWPRVWVAPRRVCPLATPRRLSPLAACESPPPACYSSPVSVLASVVFFLRSSRKSILPAPASSVVVTAEHSPLLPILTASESRSMRGLRPVAFSPHPSSMIAMSFSQSLNFFSLICRKRRAISGPVCGCACR